MITNIDKLDECILKLIAGDARKPFLEVARQCKVSGAAIHQRVQRLFKIGILTGSEFKMDPDKLGLTTCAYMGIYFKDPSDFNRIISAISNIPEIVECHCTTGNYDMFVKIYARNNAHLLEIIHDKLQPLGLQRTETIISFKECFNRQLPIPHPNEANV